MAPLKALEQEYPIIDSNFQNFCASRGIFSVEDLLLHDLYVLVAFAEQESDSERLKQGITQVLSIIDGQHRPWLNGMELLEDAHRNKHVLSTGCEGIDFLLQGGLRKGQLTELVGASSSGKTQLCLLATSNVAMEHMGSVVYLDTGNSFSPQRVTHFICRHSDPAIDQGVYYHWELESKDVSKEFLAQRAKHRILQKVMSSILCHSVFDIFTMFNVLNLLEFNLRSQMQRGDHQVQLLIIDSVSSLITPILGGSGSQGRALMVSAGFLLKKLAYEHNLAVLVTNHTVGGEGGICKPALGESWKSIPHVRLLLSRDLGGGSGVYSVSILKHPSMAPGKASRFMIDD